MGALHPLRPLPPVTPMKPLTLLVLAAIVGALTACRADFLTGAKCRPVPHSQTIWLPNPERTDSIPATITVEWCE